MRTLASALLILSILAFVAVSGCPGPGGGGSSTAVVAPVFTGYAVNPATYMVGDPVVPNLPVVEGEVDSFTVEPLLPEGMALDTATGAISGTPVHTLDETPFLLTAWRGKKSSSTTLTLKIPPPVVVLVADRPLVVSLARPSGGSAVAGTSLASSTTGRIPDAATATVNTWNTAVKVEAPSSVVAAPAPTSTPNLVWDATVPFTAMISVATQDLPVSTPLQPELFDPYSSAAVTLPSFLMISNGATADLREATVRLRLTQQGGAGLTFQSNGLKSHRLTVRQLSTGQNMTSTAWWMQYRGGLYYQSVNASSKNKLFVHDGTTLTFRQLCNMTGAGNNDGPRPLAEYNSCLFVRIRNNPTQKRLKLFRYDELTDALTCTSQTNASGDDSPDSPAVYGGSLFFSSQIASARRKLFRYTENVSGAVLTLARVVDTAGPTANDDPTLLKVHSGALYFSARLSSGARKVFRFDSTSVTSVQQVSDTAGGPSADDEPAGLTEVQGRLYFSARNTFNARKVWRYDVNTHQIEEIANLRADDSADDAPSSLVEWNGRLYFTGSPAASLTKVYRFDPASGALAQVSDTAGSGLDDAPSAAVGLAGSVYFSARNGAGARKLWRFDEATQALTQVSNTRFDQASNDDPLGLTAFAGKLYFTALRSGSNRKLYHFDPSSGNVCQVADTRVNPNADDKTTIVAIYGSHLMFTAVPAAGGSPQLFKLCDEATGCVD